MAFKDIFRKTDILIPGGADMEKWSVVACDQFTSEPEYWQRVQSYIGPAPSALHMILPEAWLAGTDTAKAAGEISAVMYKYLNEEIFRTVSDSYIYVERELEGGKTRKGLIGALDLDSYDFLPGASSAVRASENTVLSRLPARIEMREMAPLEMPHVMVLIDDPEKTVIEPLGENRGEMECLYDFRLMENGGHIRGYRVQGEESPRYTGVMIVGDGNHSLAAAKSLWDKIKPRLGAIERDKHPARYALVELVNIHDESLEIEPIHRLVCRTGSGLADKFIEACPYAAAGNGDGYKIGYTDGDSRGEITVTGLTIGETIGALQEFLDAHVQAVGGEIDYIHGEESLRQLAKKEGSIGFFMPAIEKSDIFKSVISGGVFPKKSFSMGDAADKRYYLECRRII